MFLFYPSLSFYLHIFYRVQGLVESLDGSSLASDPNIRVIALYDNEEVSYSM